jgi:hypothetical protein
LRTYVDNGAPRVVRGTFYSWFTEPLLKLLTDLLNRAIAIGQRQPKLLPGILGGVTDWRVFDSTTVRLDDALVDTFPGTGDYAALKIHKEWSVGTGNLVGYKVTPAREHDSPHLVVDEHRRGTGLLMDLGYASIKRLVECDMYDVQYVIRLKENWKPTVERLVRGAVFRDAVEGADFDALLDEELVVLDGQAIDADVTVGRGAMKVRCRLVGIPTVPARSLRALLRGGVSRSRREVAARSRQAPRRERGTRRRSARKLRKSEEARIFEVLHSSGDPHEPEHRAPSSESGNLPRHVAGVQIQGRDPHRRRGSRPRNPRAPCLRPRWIPAWPMSAVRTRRAPRSLLSGAASTW